MRTFSTRSINQKKLEGRILHITDTHLFAHQGDMLLGIDTNKSFSAVMDEIEQCQDNYDLIVATGDFVQDGSKKAYEHFAQRVSNLSVPCVFLPGNHDVPAYMSDVFSHYNLPNEKLILLGNEWILVLLNSQVIGQAYGYLPESEIEFLQQALSRYPQRNALVLLHHHPIMSGCLWLDQHCLKNRDKLEEVILAHDQIKALGCGHIHQVIERYWNGCLVFSTPSTCVQFKPSCKDFTLEENSPGWRNITLHQDGTIVTTVHRLESIVISPDMTLNGY